MVSFGNNSVIVVSVHVYWGDRGLREDTRGLNPEREGGIRDEKEFGNEGRGKGQVCGG